MLLIISDIIIFQNLGCYRRTFIGLYSICALNIPGCLSLFCLPTLKRGIDFLSDLAWTPTDSVVS